MELNNGRITFPNHEKVHLSLSRWSQDQWQHIALQQDDGEQGANTGFSAVAPGFEAQLSLQQADECYSYSLGFQSEQPTRVRLALEVSEAGEPFHVVLTCIYGDNNMAHSLGKVANLTAQHPDNPSCSPTWEMRADRAALPVSLLYTTGLVTAISIGPYAAGMPLEAEMPEEFIRNGLYAQVAHNGLADACGVVLGHAQMPDFFNGKRLPVTWHHSTGALASRRIYMHLATSRLAIHDVIRHEYYFHRDRPEPPISQGEAIDALVDAFVRVNWHDETGHNAVGSKPPPMTPFFGGVEIRENFTNMRCTDEAKQDLQAWRTLCDIGWAGGSVIADPLLLAGYRLNNQSAVNHAIEILDRIAAAINPDSGLLWDVVGKYEGKRVNWWWSGYLVQDCHCAYTNGSAVWHLLKAYRAAREWPGHEHTNWLETACSVLDTICSLQLPDGNFGFTYAVDGKAILDRDGYAGVWFVAALALAYQLTSKQQYLAAAQRGAAYYHGFTARLCCWGTPLDLFKWPDHEGNLGLIRALPLLHQSTGDARYLRMLEDAAGYEYLFRYGQRTRPQTAPLKDSHWNSCGGSCCCVFSWQHPMGMLVNADLLYLAEQTGDDYHRHRVEDSHDWGINTVSIHPEVVGYGIRGVMTECYCASNPRPGELNGDGTPSTIWHSYNGWAAAATLEGLLEVNGI